MKPLDKLKAAIVAYTNEENFDVLNEHTANVIQKTLETAVEKAKITYVSQWSDDLCVDRHSILNTFEQTYKTFEV